MELRKIGNLWTHYQHHLYEHHENIDFIGFLALHTLDQEHLQKDHHEHEDLPFHQHESNQLVKIFFNLPTLFTVRFIPFSSQKSIVFIDCYAFSLPNNTLSIWQPPKL